MITMHRLLIACSLLLLASCTSAPPKTAPQATNEAAAEEPQAAPELPDVELSPELLYKLLVAEFASQEGHLRLSADAYLRSAQQSRDPRLARRATQAAVYARDTVAALTAAHLWVELEPESVAARQSLAALMIRTGQLEGAMPHLKKIVAFSPARKSGHGFMLVANLLAQVEDTAKALALMEQLTVGHGDDPGALYAHAQLANQLGEVKLAQTLLEHLLEIEPSHTDGLILQARVLHEQGEEQAAIDSLHQALEQNPDNHQMRLTYARMLLDAQQLKEARKQFRLLNRRLPGNADVIFALGLLALEADDPDDAEPYFMDLVSLGEREVEARFALAQIAQSRGRTQEALDWYQSVPGGERYMEAQLNAAQIIADNKGSDEAVAYLQQLPLDSDEERIERYQAIAQLYSNDERHAEALATYNEALEAFHDDLQLLYARALAAERLGRIDWLERDLKRVIELDPDNAQALNALGYTLADQTDRYREALDYIQRAYALQPEDPAILDSMGWVYYRLGRHDQALDFLFKAAAGLRDGEIAAHLGEVLWTKGDKERARQVWNEAQEFAPDNRVLQQTLERFNP